MKPILNILLIIVGVGICNFLHGNNSNPSDKEVAVQKIEALNNYVDFINESTHGLMIVVKLLENFNLDINKYVDLASYKINQYNNDDLPGDIFEDLDHLFYEKSPYELHHLALNNGQMLDHKKELDGLANEMKSILVGINKIRFDLEDLIKNNDLTVRDNLTKVYQKLEECVAQYNAFFDIQKKMESAIKREQIRMEIPTSKYADLISDMQYMYTTSRDLLLKIRQKNTGQFIKGLTIHNKATSRITSFDFANNQQASSGKFKFNWSNFKSSAKSLNASFTEFSKNVSPSEQYQIYGRYYYYYNVNSIPKFNRYGTGIVIGMNKTIAMLDIPMVKFTELPHYFKVIYPKKLEKVDYVESETRMIDVIPAEVKSRQVTKSKNKIRVTDEVVEFMFFDHMIADGDLVSVSFNGEWIMEKEELEIAPKKFKLKLNKNGKNYLLLHADDIGQRPPCTIGVSYMMGGSKKEITLRSDLKVSELIELNMVE